MRALLTLLAAGLVATVALTACDKLGSGTPPKPTAASSTPAG